MLFRWVEPRFSFYSCTRRGTLQVPSLFFHVTKKIVTLFFLCQCRGLLCWIKNIATWAGRKSYRTFVPLSTILFLPLSSHSHPPQFLPSLPSTPSPSSFSPLTPLSPPLPFLRLPLPPTTHFCRAWCEITCYKAKSFVTVTRRTLWHPWFSANRRLCLIFKGGWSTLLVPAHF